MEMKSLDWMKRFHSWKTTEKIQLQYFKGSIDRGRERERDISLDIYR
jgi:hypothetical protein